MSEITEAIAARQTQITQLQSEIETLQRAAGIMGDGEEAPTAKAKQKSRLKAKTEAVPQPTPKRRPMTAAQRAAVGKRMKAYWAKQRKPSATAAVSPQSPATPKRKRAPMSAVAKKAMSKRLKAYWAKRKKTKR